MSQTATIRMAVASTTGTKIDQHFGQTEAFYVFDVTAAGAVEVDRREVAVNALPNEGSRETIIRILADCKTLLAEKIGNGPRPMLAKAGIEPVDQYAHKDVLPSLADAFAKHTG
jgi:lactoylglutathione lyase